ncbi:MAG: helix-turn-helix domain-containing protein [Planctomycetes bacterium]|nr:helix-turn-helix domain-containing protein [Planctomycetota bacterium]
MELDAVERQQILRVLDQTGGNKTQAAEILGIQRRTLYKKLARIERDRS